MAGCVGGRLVGERKGLGTDRLRDSWFKELDGWVCWWVIGGSELGAVDRQAEGQLGQGVGWLGVLVGEWWV
jgi:hypothetical protein